VHAVRGHPLQQLVDAQVAGVDAVERGERTTEDVVEAAELRGSLERDHVDRLFDDADDRVVAPRVGADRAHLFLGEVAALTTEADTLLDVLECGSERERFVLRALQDVEREPLGRPRPDPGKPAQLRDEVLDRGAEHAAHCAQQPRLVRARPNRSCRSDVLVDMTTYRVTLLLLLLVALPLVLTACGKGGGGY